MSKYNSRKTTIDGIVFDSVLESKFYFYLKHNTDKIKLLDRQVVVELLPKSGKARSVKYIADFLIEYQGKQFLVDSKGVKTDVFNLKMNLYSRLADQLKLIVAKTINEMIIDLKTNF